MMTTSRSNARIRRTPKFKLEYLDDRIVPSTIGALSHDTSHVATLQVRPEAKTPLAHEPALARLEARDEAKLAASNPTASVPGDALPVKKPPVLIPRKLPVGYHPLVVGATLQSLYAQYHAYVATGSIGTFSPTGIKGLVIDGTDVSVRIRTTDPTSYTKIVKHLQTEGLQVTQASAKGAIVVGVLPIAQLPAVANNATTVSINGPLVPKKPPVLVPRKPPSGIHPEVARKHPVLTPGTLPVGMQPEVAKKHPVLIPRKLPVGDHPLVVGARLQSLYAQYVTYVISGASTSFSPTGVSGAVVAGTDVGVKVQTSDHANFKTSLTQLQGDGLQVTQDFPASGVVEGLLPIAQLPAVANNATTVSVTLPSNVGAQLQSVYAQYEAFLNAGGKGFFLPTGVNGLVINDTSVGVNIHDSDAATFKTILAELQTDGLQVTDDSAAYGIIDGMLPIGQLPTVANISPTLSISPMLKPIVG